MTTSTDREMAAPADEEKPVADDGKFFYEEIALAEMLTDGVLFANSRRYLNEPPPHGDSAEQPETIVLFVGLNDVFYWGCADCEPLPYCEVEPLYRAWKADHDWGVIRWGCLRRKLAPQVPMEKMMREDGKWDAEMEALPKPRPS
jgi:hypothetical protein